MLYVDFPQYTTWNAKQREWRKRRRACKTIGRMFFVSPRDSERYALRLLLHHVAGAKSFDEVKTFQSIQYPTFKAAAIAHGLLTDDAEWDRCLQEASLSQMPAQLRDLFVVILIFNQPSVNPSKNPLRCGDQYQVLKPRSACLPSEHLTVQLNATCHVKEVERSSNLLHMQTHIDSRDIV